MGQGSVPFHSVGPICKGGGGKLGGANWRWGLLGRRRENLFKTGEAALGNSFYFSKGITKKTLSEEFSNPVGVICT